MPAIPRNKPATPDPVAVLAKLVADLRAQNDALRDVVTALERRIDILEQSGGN